MDWGQGGHSPSTHCQGLALDHAVIETMLTSDEQIHFPIEDVLKNIKYFLSVVKRATGNLRDPTAQVKGGKSTKPGMFTHSTYYYTLNFRYQ